MNGTLSRVKLCRGAFCCCCAAHNFPFFFDPLSSPASRLRLILRRGGGRLFYGGLAALVAPQRWGQASWGQGQATSFCNKLNSLKADPSLFPPKILPDRSRPERRCKNKRDVWISAHKRLTTHAPRVALFCLYLGIFPRPRFRVISRRQMASRAIGRQMTARTGGQSECEGAG